MKYRRLLIVLLIVGSILLILSLPRERFWEGKIAAVGTQAPDFELKDIDGNTWRLSELRGKVVFLNFWATWCPSCRQEISSKERLHKMMKGKPFQMLSIIYRDSPRKVASFIRRNGLSVPALIDPGFKVAKSYGVTGVPETFIIDKQGIIRHRIIGPRQWDSPTSLSLIERWL